MDQKNRIIFALDVDNEESAREWTSLLSSHLGYFKVGLELFTATGPGIVTTVKNSGLKCFLDLKFHDIPNTVAGAVRSATRLGVDMMTIHLAGGPDMIRAAVDAAGDEAAKLGIDKPDIIGVSVLTSIDRNQLSRTGIDSSPAEQVERLALLGIESGMNGLVCSPADLPFIKKSIPSGIKLITPGIRPEWSVKGDQARIATPASAIKAGADLLVIGRPIRTADDPVAAVNRIIKEIEE